LKLLRHIGIGFLVSFLGSLPLGYLNVAGLEIYRSGIWPLLKYCGGVVTIEVVVIYLTLIFTEKLIARKKLLRLIEAFSVLFMFVLAVVFCRNAIYGGNVISVWIDAARFPAYLFGMLLSCLNFMQLPFWTGWNLYLLNKSHIEPGRQNEIPYVIGTAAGTLCGMVVFVSVLAKVGIFFSGYLMYIIALAFALIGVVQAWKYYRKYYVATS